MKKTFDAIRFIQDNSISTADHNSKHFRDGWINIECPFCVGNPGDHLGYNTEKGFWNCHRCGFHPTISVIKALLNVSEIEARRVSKAYGSRPQQREQSEEAKRPSTLSLPYGTTKMQKPHRQYLEKRGYDPDELEELWGLKGTGLIGSYKFRIIAPILYNGMIASYQGRDYTNKAPLKYKACKAEDEIIPHKEILYGIDKTYQDLPVVVVEGITDAWRLGPGAVATFGIVWSQEQALLLKKYPRVFIMYDFAEVQAQKQARTLGNTLSGLGVDVEMLTIEDFQGDPANLPDRKAKRVMRRLLGL